MCPDISILLEGSKVIKFVCLPQNFVDGNGRDKVCALPLVCYLLAVGNLYQLLAVLDGHLSGLVKKLSIQTLSVANPACHI